jgi:hypothetical protein
MLLCGWAYRTLAAQLDAPPTMTPIAPDALERLPMQIGSWVGNDVAIDEAVVRRTDTDAHVNRRYSRGSESLSLYVGCGTRTRDLIMHRPDTCYVGAGWARTSQVPRDVPLRDGATLPCTIFQFSRGTLNATEKLIVLHYYIVDGRYCQSVSEWRYAFWRLGYVAQVQVVTSLETLTSDDAMRVISEFAANSAPQIQRLLMDCVKADPRATSSELPPMEKGLQ